MTLSDEDARRRALTSLGETLLVEAAAGTGKTALMAGRAAMLLADGVDPGAIAAITFTELAAGELGLRIREIVGSLLDGEEVPAVLRPALPTGLSAAQRTNLATAAKHLDDLTATTIHGFCQGIIRAYAVEANLDPGAVIMDAPTADAMFDTAFAKWLRSRLSGNAEEAGPVGVLASEDPLQVVSTLRALALLRRSRPTARPPKVDLSLRPDLDFLDTVEQFERWFAAGPAEPRTAEILNELRDLANHFADSLARDRSFEELWAHAHPPRTSFMKTNRLDWRVLGLGGAWLKVAGDAGPTLFQEAKAHYDASSASFAALMGQLAGALIAEVSSALDDLMEDYAAQKRAAAALDFDDLLLHARELIRRNDDVRRALGRRYKHIFVDEFQDTDPIQAEVIFGIASDELPEAWINSVPRPGSLFLVGDPKQAIYRFRGAHVAAYTAIRDALKARDPSSIIQITANFRSAPEIIDHVNRAFESPLEQKGQPGYVPLTATRTASPHEVPIAAKVTVDLPPGTSASQQRDAEAELVADICERLIGSIDVLRPDNSRSALKPGDIALLAPTGTELWRYERALEQKGISVASQAGKALMRRQETQDVLALLRALANPLDRLAFGALMRGPLVGLTESRLLAIAAALPAGPDGTQPSFTIETDPALVVDAEARSTLETLRSLVAQARVATPSALLAEAAERLKIRVALALRSGDRAGRANANLDALIALAEPYRVRGLAAFVADLSDDWQAGHPIAEGRIDESEHAVSLITIHSAKGLEWPVVIPINAATLLRGPEQFVHRQSDDTLHWILGGLVPPDLADAQAEEALSCARERERLWYVALTRARDMLIVPELAGADVRSWSKILDLGLERLPQLDYAKLSPRSKARRSSDKNGQTREVFESQAAAIASSAQPVTWRRPSEHDPDRTSSYEVPTSNTEIDFLETQRPVGAGRLRGILLHKLLEEMLTRELPMNADSALSRASELLAQLSALEGEQVLLPDAAECANLALRVSRLPAIAPLWENLEPEVPIYGTEPSGTLLAGRADAVAIEDGRIRIVLDWKSDIDPDMTTRANHAKQLADYLKIIDAPRGAIVYVTAGEVVWLTRAEQDQILPN